MKTNALPLLFLFAILSLFSACQEEDTTITDPVEPDDGLVLWENVLEGESEARQDIYNLGIQGSEGHVLTVIGRYSKRFVYSDGAVGSPEIWPTSRTIERRNAISPQFLTSSHTWEDRTALFIYHASTTIGDTHLFLRFPDHPDLPGSLFANFEDFNFAEEDAAINDQHVVLLPLRSRTAPDRPALAQFALKDPAGTPVVTIDTATFRELLLPPDPNPGFLRLQVIDDDFFVSTGYHSYRILSDGSYQELFAQPTLEFFRFQEDYYAYSGNVLRRSIDGGETWTEIDTGWPYDLSFFTVADQLFGLQNNQIYRIDPEDFSLTRIHEEQLTGTGNIRAVGVFSGHVYFATSRGLYRVTEASFLDVE